MNTKTITKQDTYHIIDRVRATHCNLPAYEEWDWETFELKESENDPKRSAAIAAAYPMARRLPQKDHANCSRQCKATNNNGKGHGPNVSNYNGKVYARAPKGPGLKELRAHVHKLLEQWEPTLLETALKKYFDSMGDWILIYTPPYCPDLQPIECFWAIIKNRVAIDWFKNRTIKETWQHLMNAMYGGPRHHVDTKWTPLTSKTFTGLVNKCKKNCDKRIKDDPLLSGTIDDLGYAEDVPQDGGSEEYEVQAESSSDEEEELELE